MKPQPASKPCSGHHAEPVFAWQSRQTEGDVVSEVSNLYFIAISPENKSIWHRVRRELSCYQELEERCWNWINFSTIQNVTLNTMKEAKERLVPHLISWEQRKSKHFGWCRTWYSQLPFKPGSSRTQNPQSPSKKYLPRELADPSAPSSSSCTALQIRTLLLQPSSSCSTKSKTNTCISLHHQQTMLWSWTLP